MLRLIYIIVLFLLTALVAPYFIGKQGVVIIQIANYTLQTSVIVFLILVIILLAILYLLEVFFNRLGIVLFGYSRFIIRHRDLKAEKQVQTAIVEKGEGNLEKAKKLLVKSIKNSKFPLVNLSEAFDISMQEGKYDEAIEFLNESIKISGSDQPLLIQTMRLRLYVAVKKYKEAEEYLKVMPRGSLNHELIKLSIEVYRHTFSFSELDEVLTIAKKRKIVTNQFVTEVKREVDDGIVDLAAESQTDIVAWFTAQSKERRNSLILSNQVLKKLVETKSMQVDVFASQILKNFDFESLSQSLYFDLCLSSELTLESKTNQSLIKLFKKTQNIELSKYLANLNFKYFNSNVKIYIDYLVEHKQTDFYTLALVVYQELNLRKDAQIIQEAISQEVKSSFQLKP